MADPSTPVPTAVASPAPSTIPQKRPAHTADDTQPSRSRAKDKPAAREPREKKDTWRKKDTLSAGMSGNASGGGGSGGNASGRHTTENATPRAADTPTLVRYRLPPPQLQDFFGHRAPPVVAAEPDAAGAPGEFYTVNDQYVAPAVRAHVADAATIP